MEAILSAVIAVVGTLLGSISTYAFHRASTARAEETARLELRRQERLAAYTEFVGAATVLRRASNDRWHRHQEDPGGSAYITARDEYYRALSQARIAHTRLRLLTDSTTLVDLADHAVEQATQVKRATDEPDRESLNSDAKLALDAFLTAAAAHLR